jgi:hypothetical protein
MLPATASIQGSLSTGCRTGACGQCLGSMNVHLSSLVRYCCCLRVIAAFHAHRHQHRSDHEVDDQKRQEQQAAGPIPNSGLRFSLRFSKKWRAAQGPDRRSDRTRFFASAFDRISGLTSDIAPAPKRHVWCRNAGSTSLPNLARMAFISLRRRVCGRFPIAPKTTNLLLFGQFQKSIGEHSNS